MTQSSLFPKLGTSAGFMNCLPRYIASWLLVVSSSTCALAQLPVGSSTSLGLLRLPTEEYDYVGYAVQGLPAHFGDGGLLTAVSGDNTPDDNPITNEGATLGRVLFYDKRLSHDNSMSCASCHQQELGFADGARFSQGADDQLTERHATSLVNAKFYENGRFFSDESAATLEEQVLLPITNPIELASDIDQLVAELNETEYYSGLFRDAFGSADVTTDGISKALSQFVRSMVSYSSKYDSAFDRDGNAHFEDTLSEQENRGRQIFHGVGRCSFCHTSEAQIAVEPHNNGLEAITTDPGAGNGAFKSPSLRNVAERKFFMHDGQFDSLEQVVDFYSSGIKDNPDLDFRLRDSSNGNQPVNLGFSDEDKQSLVAFLKTLTDNAFLTNPIFSNPFEFPCDFDGNETCDVRDINRLLSVGDLAMGITLDPEDSTYKPFDLNGDSRIDQVDIDRWLTIATAVNETDAAYQPGDANLDGEVDGHDLALLREGLFRADDRWDAGDFNGDGAVDGTDFNIWNAFATRDAAESAGIEATVPEPDSCVYAFLLAASLLMSRRWRNRDREPPQHDL